MKTTTSHWIKDNKRIKYGLRLVIGDAEEVKDVATDKNISTLQEKVIIIKFKQ